MEETKEFGNIFTGWDSYTSAEKVKQRKNVLLEDRQFSLSSVTSPASRKEVNKKVSSFKVIKLTLYIVHLLIPCKSCLCRPLKVVKEARRKGSLVKIRMAIRAKM